MGYILQIRCPRSDSDRSVLRVSVWDMSKIRDQMLALGAAFCVPPPHPPFDFKARCEATSPGIPAYKLSMIDGWWVHEDEIVEALGIIECRGSSASEDDPNWKIWIDFLRDAATSGGFLVE